MHTTSRTAAPGSLSVITVAVGVALLVVLCGVSLALGSRDLSPTELWSGLTAPGAATRESIIVWQLRMPRTALAVVVGAALAVAGAVMQALTRNPLAEPGLLGVNAGASLAVVIAIAVFGVSDVRGYVWFALAGAALAALLVQAVARRRPGAEITRLVLAGVALAASLSAVTGIVTMYDSTAFDSYRTWVVGSLENRDVHLLLWVTPVLVAGLSIALLSGNALNALSLGDEQASALGARVGATRLGAFVCITLLAGGATAAIGPVAFAGLIVPHVARLLVGADQRRVVTACILLGPVLILAADVIGRLVARPGEIEVGVVLAFVGAPLLLALVVRRRAVEVTR